MSLAERNGFRDQAYSHWHRNAYPLNYGQIDADWIEYCPRCRETIALIETARYTPSAPDKPSTVLAFLGRRAEVPTFTVLYETEPCDCSRGLCPGETVRTIRVRAALSGRPYEELAPDDWAQRVGRLRAQHDRGCLGRISMAPINRIREARP